MILHEFPDIEWLREQSRTGFENQQAVHGQSLPFKGWPNVVMNTTSSGDERKDIIAPFSLFMNLSGTSEVFVDGKGIRLGEESYCLVNKGQSYDLILPDKFPTTTFNIHFSENLFSEVFESLKRSLGEMLDNPFNSKREIQLFYSKPRVKNHGLLNGLNNLQKFYNERTRFYLNDENEQLLLAEILKLLLLDIRNDWKGIHSISSAKAVTREELVRRLNLAIEFIHDNFDQKISLDEISRAAYISKFHFVRVFKEVFQCTPHQYISNLRVLKAENLLKNTRLEIVEISQSLGFLEPNSFSRFFKQSKGVSPQMYRKQN